MTTTEPAAWAAPIRNCTGIERLQQLDTELLRLASDFCAHQRRYPALIDTQTLCCAGYHDAFPHLLLAAASLHDPAADAARLLEATNLAAPRWCLSPAVCLHVYAEFAGQMLAEPLVVTARGRCFRNEDSTSPGERQIEFEMREIVLAGSAAQLQQLVPQVQSGVEAASRRFGLSGAWTVAEDPFFLPTAQGKAYLQRLKETKSEYRTADGLALTSVNWHETFFGTRFRITDASGEPIHTACVAVGLDRWLSRGDINAAERYS
jgi:seryl-tRNA synthetase